ncbi:MAG: hypothetical protein R3220_05865 [Balneolaceae bacterium]|nr:hypothetical protein [Balneolaceae bacterium]
MITQRFNNNTLFILLYLAIAGLILIYMNGLFTDYEIRGGGGENLEMSYFLYTEGVLALKRDSTGTPIPTNYREPVPPIINAAFMYLHPGISQDASLESFKDGENTKKVKKVNLFWLLLLQLGVGYLTYILTKNKYLPFLSLLLVLIYFIRFGGHFDTLLTELPAATIIIWTTIFLIRSAKEKNWINDLILGLLLGILILTKAMYFYLGLLILIPLFFFMPREKRIAKAAIILGATLLVVTPWLIRNYAVYDKMRITLRGGESTYNRMLLNKMENEEIKGAVYLWSPALYKSLVKNTALDVDENEYLLGGKYQRLIRYPVMDYHAIALRMPEKTISYHSRVRAEENRQEYKYQQMGFDSNKARLLAHSEMKDEAIDWILTHPIEHASMTLLFIWRSIWCFPNSTIPIISDQLQQYIHNIINLISYLTIFIVFVAGVYKRNLKMVALTLIPVVSLVFLVSVSHALPRYTEPFIPSMLVSVVFLIFLISKNLSGKWSSRV